MVVVEDLGAWTYVRESSREEINELYKFLKIKDTNARYNPAFKSKRWDGYVRFYDRANNRFPSGLLPVVQKKFPSIKSEIDESRRCPILPNWADFILVHTPRHHQTKAVNAALSASKGIIEAPTGAGKSLILSGLCKAIKGKILVIVPTKNLLYQTGNDIESFIGEKVGYVGDGSFNFDNRITVGIVKSLAKLEQSSKDSINAIIVDEAHRASAATYKKFIMSVPAYYRFGLSADSFDMYKTRASSNVKKFSVCSLFGPKISVTENQELLEKGIIATPKIKFVNVPPSTIEDCTELPYAEAYCKLVCENTNIAKICTAICEKSVQENLSVLLLIKHIHHGELVCEHLKAKNLNFRFLHGSINSDIIKKQVNEFRQDKFPILVGSNIFTEGVDFPDIDVLIMAAGDVSPTKQRLGRGLRAKRGKDNIVRVYDLVALGNEYMITHAKKRAKIYKLEGHEITES